MNEEQGKRNEALYLTAVPGASNAHILTVNRPDQELVADVLFSYGNPVAAILYTNAVKAPGLQVRKRRLIHHRLQEPYGYEANGRATRRHVQWFLWTHGGAWEEGQAGAYLEDGEDFIEEILTGNMPGEAFNEKTERERRRIREAAYDQERERAEQLRELVPAKYP